MHFTTPIRPDSLTNCGIILAWIKEGRAYAKLPSHSDFTLFPKGELPNFDHLNKIGTWFKAEVKEAPKFQLNQRVSMQAKWDTPATVYGRVCEVRTDIDGDRSYLLRMKCPIPCEMYVHESELKLAEEKPKFNHGDRVYLFKMGHYHHKQTGTVVLAYLDGDYLVQFDGHECQHMVGPNELTLVKFAKGQRVKCEPTYRLAHYAKLEVVGVLGKIGEHLVYQLKATRVGGGEETVSASGGALSVVEDLVHDPQAETGPNWSDLRQGNRVRVNDGQFYHGKTGTVAAVLDKYRVLVRLDRNDGDAPYEYPVKSLVKLVLGEDPIRWAERLILQLPQTHDGRNSWLMNYGSADTEVLTDPKAVAQLVHRGWFV
jgi:hypothetical protein